MKVDIKNHFAFSKKEWNGMLIMILLIIGVFILPYAHDYFQQDKPVNFEKLHLAFAKLKEASDETHAYPKKDFNVTNEAEKAKNIALVLFDFNPNKLPEEKWRLLGLKDYQIKVIKNYESKGGRFFKNEDLKKIYSIKSTDYIRLAPYIRIPEKVYPEQKSDFKVEKKPIALVIVDINQADSATLTEISGIGPAFASRIIKYRSRLGGFVKKEQLMEVFGLDSSKYIAIEKQVVINTKGVRKIAINLVSFEDLKHFPYLSFKQMNAIIQYKKQHGKYRSIADLSKIAILNEEILRKIEPYFQFDD